MTEEPERSRRFFLSIKVVDVDGDATAFSTEGEELGDLIGYAIRSIKHLCIGDEASRFLLDAAEVLQEDDLAMRVNMSRPHYNEDHPQ